MNYFFHPKARIEHLEHIAYYEPQQKGLGSRYLSAFGLAMDKIFAAPHRHKTVFHPISSGTGLLGFLTIFCIDK